MKKIDPSSVYFRVPERPRKKVRAIDIMTDVGHQYYTLKKNLGDDQTINLSCCIGGIHYSVSSLQTYSEECIFLVTTNSEGIFHSIFCPIEQLAVFITISPRINDEPPREIGFHTMMETGQEKSAKA